MAIKDVQPKRNILWSFVVYALATVSLGLWLFNCQVLDLFTLATAGILIRAEEELARFCRSKSLTSKRWYRINNYVVRIRICTVPFILTFLGRLLMMIPDHHKKDDINSACLLWESVIANRYFCHPLSKIGAALAFLLPGFDILIGACEFDGRHYVSGAIKAVLNTVRLIVLLFSAYLGWQLASIIDWQHQQRLGSQQGQLYIVGPHLVGHYSWLYIYIHRSWITEFAYSIAFLVLVIFICNSTVRGRRKWLPSLWVIRQFCIGILSQVVLTYLRRVEMYSHFTEFFKSIVTGAVIGLFGLLFGCFQRNRPALIYPAFFMVLPFAGALSYLQSAGDSFLPVELQHKHIAFVFAAILGGRIALALLGLVLGIRLAGGI